MSYLLRTLVTAASFWVALWILPGMELTADVGVPSTGESIVALLIISVVFGLINAVIRPIVSFLSLPVTCLTLGLFTLVINAAMLWLTVWITSFLPVHVLIDTFFWTTILAALILAIVCTIVNRLIASVKPLIPYIREIVPVSHWSTGRTEIMLCLLSARGVSMWPRPSIGCCMGVAGWRSR